jgi:hypothetical protein
MTWLADAVSAKNVRNPGEHVFGAFNAISKIANSFILNIRSADGDNLMSPPASNAHDCGSIIMLIAQGIYATQHSKLLISAYSAMKAVLKAMTITSVWPMRVLQRECESFLVACVCGQSGAVLSHPLKDFAAHCGLESKIPFSNTNSVSLCIIVLAAVVEVSSMKDHTSSEFPRAMAELTSLSFSESKYEMAILMLIKANLSAGVFDDHLSDAFVRRLLMLPSNPSDFVLMSLHASCLESLAYNLQNSKLLSKSPLNNSLFDFHIFKEVRLLRKMLMESPVSLRASYFFLAASADFIVFDLIESVVSAITAALQLLNIEHRDLLPFYFGQSPKMNGMSIIAPGMPLPSLLLQSLVDFISQFMKLSHVKQDSEIGSKRHLDRLTTSSLSDLFLQAVAAKLLEFFMEVESETFRPSFQWLVSTWIFSYILDTYSLDWASNHANQQQLKVFLGAITTVLRQGELTKASTSEQLLAISVACSLIRMCKSAGLRTTVFKDCILILNCIFDALNKGYTALDASSDASSDHKFSISFDTCVFYEILHRGSFHELSKSYVATCKHPLFLSFCSTCSIWSFSDLILLLEQKSQSPLILYLSTHLFTPQLLSFSKSTFEAVLSFFPVYLRHYFSSKIQSQSCCLSDLSGTLTKQLAFQFLSVGRQTIRGFQHVSDVFSTAVVLSCCASLKYLNSTDSANEHSVGEYLSVFGEFSVRNLTCGASFCRLLPELIAIISQYKFGPFQTVAACNLRLEQSHFAAPTLKHHFTEYSQKFLELIIEKAEKSSQVSEEASQVSFTIEEVKSIIETLTLLLCSMGLDDQLGNVPLATILSFLSNSESGNQDSFSEETCDHATEAHVLWSLNTVAHAHQMEISQLIDMHKQVVYPSIAESMMSSSMSLVSFMTERVYKCKCFYLNFFLSIRLVTP